MDVDVIKHFIVEHKRTMAKRAATYVDYLQHPVMSRADVKARDEAHLAWLESKLPVVKESKVNPLKASKQAAAKGKK